MRPTRILMWLARSPSAAGPTWRRNSRSASSFEVNSLE